MNKQENINDPAALELYVSQWTDHVIFTWENGENYLQPDLTPFIKCGVDTFTVGLDNPSKDEHCKRLTEACMEWLLLQCVCDHARRELMESYFFLKEKVSKGTLISSLNLLQFLGFCLVTILRF